MLQISSDCTKCAKCVKVCPTSIIEMTDNGPLLKPERIKG
ncbi:MAG: 4Fe-4S dicluster domain-containing protein, partial [Tannerellaceae bacterium]